MFGGKWLKKVVKVLKDPFYGFAYIVYLLDSTIFYRKIPDKFYLKCRYYFVKKEKLNLKNPENFNQKIQWLKLYDRNPLYTKLADKYEVREYIEKEIGRQYLIPLLGVWNSFDEINFNILPKEFVIKCNHDSRSFIICKDKEVFDINKAREKLEKCMKRNYCDDKPNREWVYRGIKPKIIAEKYISDLSGSETKDYKFFCFNGEPKCVYSSIFSLDQPKLTFFDLDWNELPFTVKYEKFETRIEKPENFKEMIEICKKLSFGTIFVRVDLYNIKGAIYFGELTFYPHNGHYTFNPPEWNRILGGWLKLPDKN
jgi:hypothetical protein